MCRGLGRLRIRAPLMHITGWGRNARPDRNMGLSRKVEDSATHPLVEPMKITIPRNRTRETRLYGFSNREKSRLGQRCVFEVHGQSRGRRQRLEALDDGSRRGLFSLQRHLVGYNDLNGFLQMEAETRGIVAQFRLHSGCGGIVTKSPFKR